MTVATTSLRTYESIKPKLGRQQRRIYEALSEMGRASNEQLADSLQIPLSSVCGRINDLCHLGMVGKEGVTKSKYNKPATLWSVRDFNDRKLVQMSLDDMKYRVATY